MRIYCVVQILLGSLVGGKQKIGMFLRKNSVIFTKKSLIIQIKCLFCIFKLFLYVNIKNKF
jgi:hypothetical protein